MQWGFLLLALLAGLSELHSGTFYLAAVATVAFVTFLAGFVLPDEALLLTFLGGLIAALGLVWVTRRHAAARPGLPEFDLGEDVAVEASAPGTGQLIVRHRGTVWQAEMASGAPPAPGGRARIVGRRGNRLRLSPIPEPPP